MADHEHCDNLENLIGQIRNEKSPGGNTAGRIADALWNAHYASVELDEETEARAEVTARKLVEAQAEKTDAGISEAARAAADVAAALATHASDALRRLEAIEERLKFYDSLPIVSVAEVLTKEVTITSGGPGRIERLAASLYYSNPQKAFLLGVPITSGVKYYANWISQVGKYPDPDTLARMKTPIVFETGTGMLHAYGSDGQTLTPLLL